MKMKRAAAAAASKIEMKRVKEENARLKQGHEDWRVN
jgi:hypothetical protein